MKYKDELIRAMEWLAKKDETVFLGQSVSYSGNAIFNTLSTIAEDKRQKSQYSKRYKWECRQVWH